MSIVPNIYNPFLEKKYFYLPKICRKSGNSCKDLYKNKSVRKIYNNKKQNELIFDSIYDKDDKISKNTKEINKIKEDTISTMILENKKIPESWTHKSSHHIILKKLFKSNSELKKVAITNQQNNELREIYNNKLRESLPNIINEYKSNNKFGYDNDLITLINNKKRMKKMIPIPRMKNLNEEFKDMIKKQNLKIVISKPDSIKENLNNILDYRKKMALRFRYNKIKYKDKNIQMIKSKSQIINSNNIIYNINTDINQKNNLPSINGYMNKHYQLNKNIKEYEDKFMITGMNNKKFKNNDNNIIIEESVENEKNNNTNSTNKIKL